MDGLTKRALSRIFTKANGMVVSIDVNARARAKYVKAGAKDMDTCIREIEQISEEKFLADYDKLCNGDVAYQTENLPSMIERFKVLSDLNHV